PVHLLHNNAVFRQFPRQETEAKLRNHEVEVAHPPSQREADIARAQQIQRGATADHSGIVGLAKRLTRAHLYSHCRHMLAVLLESSEAKHDRSQRLALIQYYALSCCEDPGLRSQQELGRALKFLHQTIDLANTTDAKTLAIAGAVHKRAW